MTDRNDNSKQSMEAGVRTRAEIADEYKWKLESMYADDGLWAADFNRLKQLLQDFSTYQGQLGKDAATLAAGLQLLEQLSRLHEKLYVYARMRRDEDNARQTYQILFEKIQHLSVEVASATAFVVPELAQIGAETLAVYGQGHEYLQNYTHFFAEIARQQMHILSETEEKLLAMAGDLAAAPQQIFAMLNNADIKFPVIQNENRQAVELTKGSYSVFMESRDRNVRKEAFASLYSSYNGLINTIGASLGASVKKDIFYARVRKHSSSLAAALDADNISVNVYDNLINSVHDHLDLMYRYMELRKKTLRLDELHMYDVYVPLLDDYRMQIPYADARRIVLNALQPLGDAYVAQVAAGLQSGWVDVYENAGKTGGAYSWGCYDSQPYVLMNYQNQLDDVFTLAHELGHSMHSWYSCQKQAYINSQYAIFVAEVASTVNESLLVDYLLQNSSSRMEKIYLLNHYLEQFRGTVYRQTMFAEFEKIIHEQAEAGEAIVPEYLNKIYAELNTQYYGPHMVIDEPIKLEWARIPHFYNAFYVYKYATGFSAATAFKEKILTEGETARQRYLDFLAAGGSDYPLSLLQKAGVDLTTPEPVNRALEYFGRLLTELEALL